MVSVHNLITETRGLAAQLQALWDKTDALRAEMHKHAPRDTRPPRLSLRDLEMLAPTLV